MELCWFLLWRINWWRNNWWIQPKQKLYQILSRKNTPSFRSGMNLSHVLVFINNSLAIFYKIIYHVKASIISGKHHQCLTEAKNQNILKLNVFLHPVLPIKWRKNVWLIILPSLNNIKTEFLDISLIIKHCSWRLKAVKSWFHTPNYSTLNNSILGKFKQSLNKHSISTKIG